MTTSKNVLKKVSMAVLAAGIAVVAHASSASALSNYWIGSGDGQNWSSAPNWSLGRAPATSDVLVFNSAASTEDSMVVYNDQANLRLNGLTFTGGSANGYLSYGETIQMAGEIRDQNDGESINYLGNNVLAKGTVKVATVNNALLLTEGKYTIGNYPLYFRSYHESINYFGGIVVGTTGSVYVVGDTSGRTTFADGSQILRPTIVKDKGYLTTGDTKMSNLTVTASGYFEPDHCLATRNLRVEGYHYVAIVGAPACANYGRVNVMGTVNVTNGKLMVTDALDSGYTPAKGARYVLVANDGTDKVTGLYKNRPEGSTFKIGSLTFKITYKGGTGNDIIITRL